MNNACRVTICLRVCVTYLVLTYTAHASPLEIYGFDGRSISMANAMTASSNDYSAAFYNPGQIGFVRNVVAGAGWSTHMPRFGIQLDRLPQDENHLPVYPDRRSAVTVGGLFPLGSRLGDRVGLSVAAHAPIGPMLEGDLYAPETPQFYRYQGRANKFVALAAIGIKATEWLSLGLGIQGLADLVGDVDIRLRLSDRSVTGRDATVTAPFKVSPTAGLVLRPIENLNLGFTWRQSIQLDFDVPSAIQLDDSVGLDLRLTGTTLFTPTRFAMGGSYVISQIDLLVSLDIVWTRWSKAPDPSLDVNLDASGELLKGLGLEERLDVVGSAPVDLAFKDTWSLRTGFEQRPLHWLAIRAGYAFEPSPAPRPIGAYNYLDPTSHRISFGAGFAVKNPIAKKQQRLHVDIAYALTLIQEESIDKMAGAQDPIGNFLADGHIHLLAVTLRHEM